MRRNPILSQKDLLTGSTAFTSTVPNSFSSTVVREPAGVTHSGGLLATSFSSFATRVVSCANAFAIKSEIYKRRIHCV